MTTILRTKGLPPSGGERFKKAKPMAPDRNFDDSAVVRVLDLYHQSKASVLLSRFLSDRDHLSSRFGSALRIDVTDDQRSGGAKTIARLELETDDREMSDRVANAVEQAGFRLLFKKDVLVRENPNRPEEETGMYHKTNLYVVVEDPNSTGDPRNIVQAASALRALSDELCGKLDPQTGEKITEGIMAEEARERKERQEALERVRERSQRPSIVPKPG